MARKLSRSDKYAGGFPPGMEAFHNLRDPRIGKTKRRYLMAAMADREILCGGAEFPQHFLWFLVTGTAAN
jgi:hypothetical protein